MNLLAVVKNESRDKGSTDRRHKERNGSPDRIQDQSEQLSCLEPGFQENIIKGFRSGFQWYEPPNRETTTNRQFISQIVSCLDETESRKRFWSPRKDSRARQKMFGENESRRSERKRDAAGNPRRRMALIGHGTVLGGNLVSGLLFPTPYCRASRTSASVA